MWQVIGLVSGGFTLLAFLIACVVAIYQNHLKSRERLILSAPEEDRPDLVAATLDYLKIDASQLTRVQQFTIVRDQISERSQRFRWIIVAAVIVFAIAAGFGVFALSRDAPAPARMKAEILNKSGYAKVPLNKTIELSGRGFDPAAGEASGASLAWQVDGAFRTSGPFIAIPDLGIGTHSIKLIASNSDSAGEDSFSVEVFEPRTPYEIKSYVKIPEGYCGDVEVGDGFVLVSAGDNIAPSKLYKFDIEPSGFLGEAKSIDVGPPFLIGLEGRDVVLSRMNAQVMSLTVSEDPAFSEPDITNRTFGVSGKVIFDRDGNPLIVSLINQPMRLLKLRYDEDRTAIVTPLQRDVYTFKAGSFGPAPVLQNNILFVSDFSTGSIQFYDMSSETPTQAVGAIQGECGGTPVMCGFMTNIFVEGNLLFARSVKDMAFKVFDISHRSAARQVGSIGGLQISGPVPVAAQGGLLFVPTRQSIEIVDIKSSNRFQINSVLQMGMEDVMDIDALNGTIAVCTPSEVALIGPAQGA